MAENPPLITTDQWNRCQRAIGEKLRELRKRPLSEHPLLVPTLRNLLMDTDKGTDTYLQNVEAVVAIYLHMQHRIEYVPRRKASDKDLDIGTFDVI